MTEKIRTLYKKYEEFILYVFFGGLTTVVNIVVFWLFADAIKIHYLIANMAAWVASVLFAYVTNRKWVFKSKNPKILKEFLGFASSRVSTLIMDIVIMWLTVNVIGMNYWIAKIFISSVIVTIANYVFSKLLIFKKKEN